MAFCTTNGARAERGGSPGYFKVTTSASLAAYSDPWGESIREAAERHDVPEPWIRAVIEVESSWNPTAYRFEPRINDASYGLMQLLYGTAQDLGYSGAASGLFDPDTNIDLGAKLLGRLRQQNGDDFARVYSAYNSGRPDRYLVSSQVYSNVQRALNALSQYATVAVQNIIETGATVTETAAEHSGGVLLFVGALFLLAAKRSN